MLGTGGGTFLSPRFGGKNAPAPVAEELQYTSPPFHHSTIPPFHHSIIPPFHHSTIPSFHHSPTLPRHTGHQPTFKDTKPFVVIKKMGRRFCRASSTPCHGHTRRTTPPQPCPTPRRTNPPDPYKDSSTTTPRHRRKPERFHGLYYSWNFMPPLAFFKLAFGFPPC